MSSSYPLRQLGQLCAKHPLEPKFLLAPDIQAGYDLTTSLARSGSPWTNLRVTTPLRLAAEQTQPQMARAGGRRLYQVGRQRLVGALLARWPKEERHYFKPLNETSAATDAGLAESLAAAFDTLRLTAVLPEQVSNASEEAICAEKASDLVRLFTMYVSSMKDGKWWDEAMIFSQAQAQARLVKHAPKEAIWIILDETELSPLAAEYVRLRSGNNLWRLGRRSYGLTLPSTSAAACFSAAPIPMEDGRIKLPAKPPTKATKSRALSVGGALIQGDMFLDPLREANPSESPGELYAQNSRPWHVKDGIEISPGGRLLLEGLTQADANQVCLRQVVGLEAEVRTVLREVLQRGLPLDDVEIAYTSATPYQSLLFDAVERWQVPADFAAGIPTGLTPPGRSLLAFTRWVAADLSGQMLVACLRSGEIDWVDPLAPPDVVARWLLLGRVAAGRQDTFAAIDRFAALKRDDKFSDRLAAGRARLNDLFACVPEGDAADDLLRGAIRFLQSQTDTADGEAAARNRRVRDGLISHLQLLSGLPAIPGTRATQADHLLHTLRDHTSEAQHAQPGRLRLSPLTSAAYCHRRHLYILGLDESRFPGPATQDPILLDDERRFLSPSLPLLAKAGGTAVFHLIRVLGSAAGTVTLLASRVHLADGREPYPTPLFEQARRQLQQEPPWSGPVPAHGGGAVDDLEVLLAHRHQSGVKSALMSAYPGVGRGLTAAQARSQIAPSRFSGWIAQEGVEALDVNGSRTLSSRMLETLAECPRRYFMRYGLGLVPAESPMQDPRRWLQPLEMGILLHGLFLNFMQQLHAEEEHPRAEHETRLQQMVEDAIANERERVPVTLEAAYRNDCRRIERAARIFLFAEAQRLAADTALHPAAFELDFGFDETIEVRLSHDVAFRLRGRIDRVDAVRDAAGTTTAYEIWDYKTGSTFNYSGTDLLQGARTLQWALYAYAIPHLMQDDGHVRLSGYFFASDRGAGQRFSDAPPARHELAASLQPLFALAQQGFFPALHKGDREGGGPCRFCDFKRICAQEAQGGDQAQGLLEGAAELTALVEGWAEAVSAQRSRSRRSLEAAFAKMGLVPGDVAPEGAARSALAWVRS